MTLTTDTVVCRACHTAFPADQMAQARGVPTHICKACKAAQQRAVGDSARTSVDPCPVCGCAQAQHWKCAQCSSRGHQMGRGRIHTNLCGWCEAERLNQQQEAA